MPAPSRRIGRFAPSPTGLLHAGSLLAALASCLEARSQGGQWLVRIEDVDLPRCSPEAAHGILRQLESFGFEWDGEPLWQSHRSEAYTAALERLRAAGHVYPCACTRREIADSALLAPDGAHRYPGTCRTGLPPGRSPRAWRLRCPPGLIAWHDAVQGTQAEDVNAAVGDFVLLRADGLFAYQLAVVVDDAEQGIGEIVRGADLLDSTARQILLQRLLGHDTPRYAHLPVLTNAGGEKLSKQTRALPLDETAPGPALATALDFLSQQPPDDLAHWPLPEIWHWALAHWSLTRVPKVRQKAV
ncbi:MAG: tRNA glutamyl-Q(34) synthetase GluQRS [Candidatus Dactylopiibacterium carminicum]|uniref:Glutamyl-Q tRNA(Asp) synthetase n=1 Tax=Candidatus Dactylopiibacterium carminicum TaxID=857335 RepID=A0A272EQ06_9RHOO|nr:tRNA glutamyl-Q(34) synthetase GluQRS [Candidatus Dactylopiibacterium carminicum]KAF7598404.1 tRNA glutamyl-Q(34) synthetase GluQRS [Candidatus Dactylopiibacterium carminicum]PAS92151.1 MAG: tRNA glutamyl-Q(34) synthetase GluQRS [Candidatus Dactylopiibacterium carminicum]PAS95579.1 MAG: tRNA glutamyl-Q(34) synthetase GluQRS [Candidatus Dactylopiibacterium carminicum]PAS97569.1 MAG: tRNA glutamyl-Q(34) synthetase GluQRS [Candidatus Dactylopiibacterium carminicum]